MIRGKISIWGMLLSLFFIFIFITPSADAHILIIADGDNSTPDMLKEATTTASALKSRGYKVLELYKENATTKNMLKGMYKADAVIYLGHGGYQSGHYNNNGGVATPPFALVGQDDFLWGVGDKMREGWYATPVTAPFKSNIPVILAHACFSTGWVENKEVANPLETIYNFSRMFTGAGANYYATAYYGNNNIVDMVDEFLNGAINFGDANKKNTGITITTKNTYNGQTIWRNNHGYAAFIGDWNAKFPSASQTTAYDDAAAERWYQSPKIYSIKPSNGATRISPSTSLTVTFTKNIVAGSNFWIDLINKSGNVIPIYKSISGNVLTIKPKSSLAESFYTLVIHSGAVTDTNGNPVILSASKFIVGTSPLITSTSPVNYARNVARNKVVTITFNEAIKKSGNCWIELKSSTGKKIVINTIIFRNKLIIKHTTLLAARTRYTLILHTGCVTDLAGNPLILQSRVFTTGST